MDLLARDGISDGVWVLVVEVPADGQRSAGLVVGFVLRLGVMRLAGEREKGGPEEFLYYLLFYLVLGYSGFILFFHRGAFAS